MDDAIIKGSIWLALLAYFTVVIRPAKGIDDSAFPRVRWIWTLGCIAYVIHVIAAFHFHHHWSHTEAEAHTAQQTESVVGWRFGAGIWFNHLFTLAWLGDVIWMWIRSKEWFQRPRALSIGWQIFFFFIVFNATVVFEDGLVRWFGLLGCSLVALRARALGARAR